MMTYLRDSGWEICFHRVGSNSGGCGTGIRWCLSDVANSRRRRGHHCWRRTRQGYYRQEGGHGSSSGGSRCCCHTTTTTLLITDVAGVGGEDTFHPLVGAQLRWDFKREMGRKP